MDRVSHQFTKTSTCNMSIPEIKRVTSNMINDLIKNLKVSNIHLDMISQLELNSEDSNQNSPRELRSYSSTLHRAISNMKTFPHVKGKRYTTEQLEELEQILWRFPDDHLTICRAIKIPKSTFYRLKEELNKKNSKSFKSKRRSEHHSYLSTIEKTYISKIVKPPTSPKSIRSIRN